MSDTNDDYPINADDYNDAATGDHSYVLVRRTDLDNLAAALDGTGRLALINAARALIDNADDQPTDDDTGLRWLIDQYVIADAAHQTRTGTTAAFTAARDALLDATRKARGL